MLRTCFCVFLFICFELQAQQRFFEAGDFQLENGQVIKQCRIGYRTLGKLNWGRTNAILFPAYFTGTSEALQSYEGGVEKYWTQRVTLSFLLIR
ncbi:MAG: hypothetical protein RMJ44_00835 [Cytophagales bacterium]|nr:hypothetical protein [Bernardetiaceae bacterium]MDW8209605.1 hypothetical protein [Cytophagales bacterium]